MVNSAQSDMKQVDEILARRAVAGVDADILEAGGSPAQADAVRAALRFYILGDVDGARRELGGAFENAMVERILAGFASGQRAAAEMTRTKAA